MQVLTSHKSQDWFTPKDFIEKVRQVLGSIDLDPATSQLPQTWIQATRYFTTQENGLAQVWKGKVFVNPPYGKTNGKSNQEVWSKKLIKHYENGEIEEAILLVNSTHGYKWYESLWTKYPVCLVRERIRFVKPDGTVGGQAKRGQTFVYFGSNVKNFNRVFSSVGRVILPLCSV